MKYIKTFESKLTPQIGDYVICKDEYNTVIQDFISNSIGIIIPGETGRKYYTVKYENIPRSIRTYFRIDGDRSFGKNDIVYHSKNKEDLEHFVQANKYNL